MIEVGKVTKIKDNIIQIELNDKMKKILMNKTMIQIPDYFIAEIKDEKLVIKGKITFKGDKNVME
jgi:preprotein translocase subunit YajC